MSSAPSLSNALPITVEVIEGPHKGHRQTFESRGWKVGRGPENDLVLARDQKISRVHIHVESNGQQVFVKNVSKSNVMMVDGLLSVDAIVKPGGTVKVGESVIRLYFEMPQSRPVLSVVSHEVGPHGATMPGLPVNTRTGTLPGQIPPVGGLGQVHFRQPPPQVDMPLFSHPKFKFYGIIGVVVLFGLWMFNSESIRRQVEKLRSGITVNEEMATSDKELEVIREEMRKKGVDTPQFRLAEAQFIKGFREYQQGQYSRAMEAFQSARSFYPEHELATRYFTLARRRFDERVQMHMITGRRYLGAQNYRLCQSSFAAAMMLLKDDTNPTYLEARQFHEECRVKGSRK